MDAAGIPANGMCAAKSIAGLFLLIGVACGAVPAEADEPGLQPLESLGAAAEAFVRERLPKSESKGVPDVRITADSPDPRLRLHRCPAPLVVEQRGTTELGPRTTVAVRCPNGAQWTIYIAVALETQMPVLVLRRAVARGAVLGPDDVEIKDMWVKGTGAGYLSKVEQLARVHAKRPLSAGAVLAPDMLAAAVLVKRGQEVILVAQAGGIEVRAKGVALSDGVAAGRVRVQNLNSQRVVEGVVTDESVVRVAL